MTLFGQAQGLVPIVALRHVFGVSRWASRSASLRGIVLRLFIYAWALVSFFFLEMLVIFFALSSFFLYFASVFLFFGFFRASCSICRFYVLFRLEMSKVLDCSMPCMLLTLLIWQVQVALSLNGFLSECLIISETLYIETNTSIYIQLGGPLEPHAVSRAESNLSVPMPILYAKFILRPTHL